MYKKVKEISIDGNVIITYDMKTDDLLLGFVTDGGHLFQLILNKEQAQGVNQLMKDVDHDPA